MDTTTYDTSGRPHTDVEAVRAASRQARAAVRDEVRVLIAEVKNLIRCVRSAKDPEVARARAGVQRAAAATKSVLAARTDQVRRQAGVAFDASDRYVHEQPWRAIGVVAVSGIIIGWLLAGRRMNRLE